MLSRDVQYRRLQENNNDYKDTLRLPRQECGVQGISWHSADMLRHSFPRTECETCKCQYHLVKKRASQKCLIFVVVEYISTFESI
jgi:hypothetical protein